MFILAGIILCFGVCAGVLSAIDLTKLPPEMQPQIQKLEEQSLKLTGSSLQVIKRNEAIVEVVLCLLVAVVGAFVRTGRRGGIIAGMVLIGLGLLCDLKIALTPGGIYFIPIIVFAAVVLGILVMILRWLIRAWRNAAILQNAQAHYQMQFQQYQQQAPPGWQAAAPPAGSGGYGYSGYVTPPPQNPGNPPAPSTDQNTGH